MAIDKESLFKGVLPEEDVELPNGKGTIRIRALTRHEMQQLRADKEGVTGEEVEIRMLVYGMVEPSLDINEAKDLAAILPVPEWRIITEAIGKLSGMGKDDDHKSKGD